MPRVEFEKLSSTRQGEPSTLVRERVENARKIQLERLVDSPRTSNGELSPRDIRQYCALDNNCLSLLRSAARQLGLSARAYHKVLKLARTIADLAGEEKILPSQIAEALQYQPRERV